jgi:hypothetical protein
MIVEFQVAGEGLVKDDDTEFVWREWGNSPLPRVGECVFLDEWGAEDDGVVERVYWRVCDPNGKYNGDHEDGTGPNCDYDGLVVTVILRNTNKKRRQGKVSKKIVGTR